MFTQGRTFIDRRDAGFALGKQLEAKYKDRDVLVPGIPRGGIEVAYEVAKILNGELSTVITKKLPHPLQEELAIGAAAEDGSVYLTSLADDLQDSTIRRMVKEQAAEIEGRIRRFRKGNPIPVMKGRIVIIMDDGIATGSTIVPAIKLCQSKQAAWVVAASPVSGERYVSDINSLADDVIIVEQPEFFYAVGQAYENFHNLSDREVLALIAESEQRNLASGHTRTARILTKTRF